MANISSARTKEISAHPYNSREDVWPPVGGKVGQVLGETPAIHLILVVSCD